MKTIQYIFVLVSFLFLNQAVTKGDTLKPVERVIGNLHISIDPRIELLTTIQLLADYPVINRNKPYSKEVINYFKSFSSQEAVKITDSLFQKYGFSHDASPTLMLYLSQVPELEQQMNFSERLIERGGGAENLEQYRKAIKQFAEISNFEVFWNSRITLYNQILDLTIAEMDGIDLVKNLEDYYNETQNSYNIILSPSFSGGYGPRIPAKNGKYDIYACLTTWYEKEGVPYMAMEDLQNYIWHEWGHSFVNHLTEKYRDRIDASSELLEPIAKKIAGKSYPYWYQSVNEHLIRAIHVRLLELHTDSQKAKKMLDNELEKHFIYIEPIIEKLKEFEKQRDTKNISFSEFYPEFFNLFDSLLKIEYWKQIDMRFKGPINKVSSEEKLVCIYPTKDADTTALKISQNYASSVFDMFFKSKGGILLADTTALKTDLSKYGIIAYGTIESNLFLKQYASTFPFKVENQVIYADKEYTDEKIKFITCVPNPLNPEIGMSIYTALSNRYIQGINNVFHGMEDYILFLNENTILSKGFYKKEGKWEF